MAVATDVAVDEHAALAARARNLFATPEWLSLWWRHHGAGGPLPIEDVRSGGQLAALVPLYVWRNRPIRVARFAGHGAGDELGPVCAPGDEELAADAVGRWLAENDVDVLVAEQLPADRRWRERLGARGLRAEGSPRLRFAGRDWDAYLATRSRNFRSLLRRAERKTQALAGARYRLAADPAALGADLDALFDLHRLRWRGRTTAFLAHEAFHREFAEVALARGWLRLWLLESDGAPVAAWYGFRFAGGELYYQAGRDPRWDHASAGLALLAHTIREAQADGMREYRFLRGGEEYKYRFTSDDPGLETVAVTRTVRGATALRAADLARRLRPRLRPDRQA
jgi:CelD/BcsL family acetyltransferase involved in cellulose biosynthesis